MPLDKTALIISLLNLFVIQGCVSSSIPETTVALQSSDVPSKQLDLSQMIEEEWASTSPNGNWVAAGLVAFPRSESGDQQAYVRLMIFRVDGKTHWAIFDEWKEIGLGFPFPAPLKWSEDDRHFYFTQRVTPDGCSAFPLLTNLQRVDLADGTVEELLPHSALALALAPDESKVAYVGEGDRGLILKDFVTGEERETKIDPGKDFDAGNLVWSPDGASLALTLAIHPCTGPYGVSKTVWAESTTVIQVDVETFEQRILVEEDPRLFITWEWNEPGKITVVDGEQNSVWQLDGDTGEITRKE